MILGRIAVGLIIFVVTVASYLYSTIAGEDVDEAISVPITVVMSSLFTGMALYILIQKGLI